MTRSSAVDGRATPAAAALPAMPQVIDQVALARLYGEPLFTMPQDLYIPPDALEVFLEAFEGPIASCVGVGVPCCVQVVVNALLCTAILLCASHGT